MFFKRRKLQSRPVFRAEKNSTRSCNCGAAGSGGPVITGAVVPLLIGTKLYFLMTGCVCVCYRFAHTVVAYRGLADSGTWNLLTARLTYQTRCRIRTAGRETLDRYDEQCFFSPVSSIHSTTLSSTFNVTDTRHLQAPAEDTSFRCFPYLTQPYWIYAAPVFWCTVFLKFLYLTTL